MDAVKEPKVKAKIKMVALVRKERGGEVKHVKAQSPSKYTFRQKLREKNLRIIVIITVDEVKEIKKMDLDQFMDEKFIKLAESERKRIYEYVTDNI